MNLEILKKIEGKQTVETIAETLNLQRQSALNLISKLKKEGYLTTSGGRQQKRIYEISAKKKPKKESDGMFDILNKYSKEKIIPPFMHEPHSKYHIENAIIDLLEFDEVRIVTNIFPLFNHVNDWSRLYNLAKKKGVRRKLGAIYEIAKQNTRVKRIPEKTMNLLLTSDDKKNFAKSSGDFKEIEKRWNIKIPFKKNDLEAYK